MGYSFHYHSIKWYLVIIANTLMESGMDPEIKEYFKKIISSLSFGLLWLTINATVGIYFGFAYKNGRPVIFTVLFYCWLVLSLVLLLRFYYKTWKK